MNNPIVWGINFYPKNQLSLSDNYCTHSNFQNNEVICDARIHVGSTDGNKLDATFDADVLTGQKVLGQWTYDVDAEGNLIIKKRQYRILSLRVEFEEIKGDKA